jgi:hypothetical protein
MGAWHNAISEEKVPYLVTIFFASLGWVVTYSVERMDKSPTIMFRTTQQDSGGQKTINVRIENITRDKVFTNLQFACVLERDGDKFIRPWIAPVPPATEGQVAPTVAGHSLTFNVAQLQPGWQLDLGAEYDGSGKPSFRLENSSDTVRLVTPSVETFVVLHEFVAMATVLGLYLLIILLVMFSKQRSAAGGYVQESAGGRPSQGKEVKQNGSEGT